jgi:hypothetical protein
MQLIRIGLEKESAHCWRAPGEQCPVRADTVSELRESFVADPKNEVTN